MYTYPLSILINISFRIDTLCNPQTEFKCVDDATCNSKQDSDPLGTCDTESGDCKCPGEEFSGNFCLKSKHN